MRQTEERAKQYYDKIRKQEAEVTDLRRELASSQSKLGDVQRQKFEMDKKMSDLQTSMDGMMNRTIKLLQRNVENHRQSIAADQTEMERSNAEAERLDHVIADLMRRRWDISHPDGESGISIPFGTLSLRRFSRRLSTELSPRTWPLAS